MEEKEKEIKEPEEITFSEEEIKIIINSNIQKV